MPAATTSPPSQRRAPALRAALVAMMFVLIGTGTWALNRSGTLWSLLAGRLHNHAAHQLQYALFQLRSRRQGAPVCLAMGDRAFLQQLASHGASGPQWIQIPLASFSYRQVQLLLENLPSAKLDLLAIQNHPAYWSNYRMKDAGVQLELWNRLGSAFPGGFAIEDMAALVHGLRDWAQAPPAPRVEDTRLRNLDELRFQETRPDRDEMAAAISRYGAGKLLWIDVSTAAERGSNPALVESFQAFTTSVSAQRSFGAFVDVEDGSLRGTLAGCGRAHHG